MIDLAKKQRHDMVHVEIWMGDGEKTLGARWQKGRFVCCIVSKLRLGQSMLVFVC